MSRDATREDNQRKDVGALPRDWFEPRSGDFNNDHYMVNDEMLVLARLVMTHMTQRSKIYLLQGE